MSEPLRRSASPDLYMSNNAVDFVVILLNDKVVRSSVTSTIKTGTIGLQQGQVFLKVGEGNFHL